MLESSLFLVLGGTTGSTPFFFCDLLVQAVLQSIDPEKWDFRSCTVALQTFFPILEWAEDLRNDIICTSTGFKTSYNKLHAELEGFFAFFFKPLSRDGRYHPFKSPYFQEHFRPHVRISAPQTLFRVSFTHLFLASMSPSWSHSSVV